MNQPFPCPFFPSSLPGSSPESRPTDPVYTERGKDVLDAYCCCCCCQNRLSCRANYTIGVADLVGPGSPEIGFRRLQVCARTGQRLVMTVGSSGNLPPLDLGMGNVAPVYNPPTFSSPPPRELSDQSPRALLWCCGAILHSASPRSLSTFLSFRPLARMFYASQFLPLSQLRSVDGGR